MSIPFRKITQAPQDFEITKDELNFKGTLVWTGRTFIDMNFKLSGKLEVACDTCAEEIMIDIKEPIHVLLSNGVYDGEEVNLDVVEIRNYDIDLEQILDSEIELIKSGYFYCDQCNN